jgi:peptidyl-tRNA hydrolase
LPLGVLCAQITHAAGESSLGNLPENTHAVVLAASDQAKLLALERKLIEAEIPHKAIREPDDPWNGQLMAIGINPTYRHLVKKFVSNLPLLR